MKAVLALGARHLSIKPTNVDEVRKYTETSNAIVVMALEHLSL